MRSDGLVPDVRLGAFGSLGGVGRDGEIVRARSQPTHFEFGRAAAGEVDHVRHVVLARPVMNVVTREIGERSPVGVVRGGNPRQRDGSRRTRSAAR